MKRCTVCGEIVADDVTECPVCHAKTFAPVEDKPVYACEHHVGDGVVEDKEVMEGLRAHFTGECTEVGMLTSATHTRKRSTHPSLRNFSAKS